MHLFKKKTICLFDRACLGQVCVYLFSAYVCPASANVICGGGVTQTVPVTASSVAHQRYIPQNACLGTESEMPGMVHNKLSMDVSVN